MKPIVGSQLEIKIDKLSYGHGHGVGRVQGFVVFVPESAPGDELLVEIQKSKKSFAEADIIKILKPGPSRVSPACRYFSECGGCQWQHVAYDEQLAQKQSILEQTFARAGLQVKRHKPILSAGQPTRYRNRIQLQFSNGKMGYRAKGSHDLVAIDDCLIADERLIRHAKSLTSRFSNDRIEIHLNHQFQATHSDSQSEQGSKFFAQVNNEVNDELTRAVVDELKDQDPTLIYDLYGGQGNFAFPLAKALPSARIFSVDSSESNVAMGLKRAADERVTNIEFINKMTHQFLKKSLKKDRPDFIVLDPPRAGLDERTIDLLIQLKCPQLSYISCDPQTLVRDLKKLSESNWSIESCRAYDMFPNTFHIESYTSLKLHS